MSRGSFTAIKTEGGLLPAEVLERVSAEDSALPGTAQTSYHLAPNERLGEAINRSWNRLLGLWEAYSEALAARGENHATTGLTRDRWLLPLFDELGYGRLRRSTAVEIEGKSFAISHAWYRTPIHLVGAGVSIDRRSPGVAGAAAAAPHSLVQEFLNRSDEHLWAFVSNGRLLRILRDNHSLSRQAYVEFDLEAIMEGELFSDFRVLWLICHQSRVEAEEPEEFLLESWFQLSREEGVRALDALRDGVERAIEAFGAGFLRHPANGRLHEGLRSGELDRQDYYRELLRLIYRLIFLFVAEDREALLDPNADGAARQRYSKYYASNRLRELAGRRRGQAHDDLWRGLRLVLSKLHEGSLELGLPALGSFLWSPDSTRWIGDAELQNDDLLSALRALCYTMQDHQLLPVNWRTLGSEELGSVYESLLELHPRMNREAGTFELDTAAGHERKTTGSYYTPTSLVDRLIESALEPVLREAMKESDPEAALLDLKVCDTAAGSGHFLVAAARRIALRLASVRTGDEEASPEAVSRALRDVVGRCIYGVDLNPLAVELCKVSLWMEALEPGKPLSFLDHHIQLGNSLLGTTPQLMKEGIPTEAFKEIEGDDKKVVRELRKRNRKERKSEQISFHTRIAAEPGARYAALNKFLEELSRADDSTLEAVQRMEERYHHILENPLYRSERIAADAWCAAFVWRKSENALPAITEDVFRQIEREPDEVPGPILGEVRRLRDKYRFFHFHLAFPDVFGKETAASDDQCAPGWSGGFDVVVGNPPWEAEELVEREYFASRVPAITEANTKAERSELLAQLEDDDPQLHSAWLEEKRLYSARTHFVRSSGMYPLGGSGKINTYRLFAELNVLLISPTGRAGMILKSGIVNAQDSLALFGSWARDRRVHSALEFINTQKIFSAVVANERFCLLTIGGVDVQFASTILLFGATSVADLIQDRYLVVDSDILPEINPNDHSLPPVADQKSLDILARTHRKFDILYDETVGSSSWKVAYTQGHLNSATGSALFKDNTWEAFAMKGIDPTEAWGLGPDGLIEGDWLPLYEGKFFAQCNHRFGTFEGVSKQRRFGIKAEPRDPTERELSDPDYEVIPRYWISHEDASRLFHKKETLHPWLFAFRDVCRGIVDARTVQACVLPRFPCVDGAPLLVLDPDPEFAARTALFFNVLWSSFIFDFIARQKIPGSHLTKAIAYQLPIPSPSDLERKFISGSYWDFLLPRAIELTVVTNSLVPVGRAASSDVSGPFIWNKSRRGLLRCECDAAIFHLYGMDKYSSEFVLDSFPIVERRDREEHGHYRTKLRVLDIYEQMAKASQSGLTYDTKLDPPPADPSVTHPMEPPGEVRT